MFPFHDIIGHATVLRVLNLAISKPAHAYLFCGARGVGKGTVAERFAAELLKESRMQNRESSAKILHSQFSILDTHPDFVRIRREEGGREIVVKQARELLARMHLTSACGGYKVALIEEADRLNEEAANALLKAVEEPSANTVYIFVAHEPDRLPATLRSRLVKIEFGRLTIEERGKIKKDEDREAWHHSFDWPSFVNVLAGDAKKIGDASVAATGKQLSVIEKVTKAVESQPDQETAWHEALDQLMRALDAHFEHQPESAAQFGKGLSHAWHLVGTAISPRLALEYAVISDQAKRGRLRPRVLLDRET